ncbi:MAG TPA: FliM/FliN family flagellar motor switch protein [Gammaproteobacteria bacterium]|nr:FliM/FliN family flagellar motor switch protein [Gammaproteobacteria bacterium]
MKAQPYRLIGQRSASRLRAGIAPVLADWAGAWLPDTVEVQIREITALHLFMRDTASARVQKRVSWLDDNWCALLGGGDIFQRLGALLIGEHSHLQDEPSAHTSLDMEVAAGALHELMQRLLAGPDMAHDAVPSCAGTEAVPATALRPGSGAVTLRLELGATEVDLALSPATVNRYVEFEPAPASGAGKKLVAFDKALAGQRVTARVRLGTAEFTLQELASFEVGDVVTLDKDGRIDKPCALVFDGAASCGWGYIGKRQGHLAFRLTDVTHNTVN